MFVMRSIPCAAFWHCRSLFWTSWGLTWYLLVGWLILLGSDRHGWCLAGSAFSWLASAVCGWLQLTLAVTGGLAGSQRWYVSFRCPLDPIWHIVWHNMGFIFVLICCSIRAPFGGVIIRTFHCKYLCFCDIIESPLRENKIEKVPPLRSPLREKKNTGIAPPLRFKTVRWPEASG